MSTPAPLAFLLDVDNTLLDNDRVHADLEHHLEERFGADAAARYWALYEALRVKLGYADYLGAIQQFRLQCDDELEAQHLAGWLLDYPFAERLYPDALETIGHLASLGTCIVLSDGDVVLQPRKIAASGIDAAVAGRTLIYVHKERMLEDVARRYPAMHYVMVEDKLRVLDGMKRQWREHLTTVFVRQGHYANDPAARGEYPPAQIELDAIGQLRGLGADVFLSPEQPANATE
jgi:FMN phosphatase YigB (HAD superfamily)